MRTIIAGGRDCNDMSVLHDALAYAKLDITTVICGEAKGADTLGKIWAYENNVPVESYPANWEQDGKSAGYKRNVLMAENAEQLLALWDTKSKGTKHMIDIATKNKIKVTIYITKT